LRGDDIFIPQRNVNRAATFTAEGELTILNITESKISHSEVMWPSDERVSWRRVLSAASGRLLCLLVWRYRVGSVNV
jgi:hypothetical protein